jgi:hypothetical protein
MTRISSFAALAAVDADTGDDLLTVVDMSETGDARNKKMTFEEFAVAVVPQLRITADGAITVEVS